VLAGEFPEWQVKAVAVLQQIYAQGDAELDKRIKEAVAQNGLIKDKRIMPFVQDLKKRVAKFGHGALERGLVFDEGRILRDNHAYIKASLAYDDVVLVTKEEAVDVDEKIREIAVPGEPAYIIENMQ